MTFIFAVKIAAGEFSDCIFGVAFVQALVMITSSVKQ